MKSLSSLLIAAFIYLNMSIDLSSQSMNYDSSLNGYYYIDSKNISHKDLIFQEAILIHTETWKVKFKEMYGLYSVDGYFSLDPIFDDIQHIQDSSLVVTIDGFVGIVDYEGKIILEPEYDKIDHYNVQIDKTNDYSSLLQLNGIWGNWQNDIFIEDNSPIFMNPTTMPVPEFCHYQDELLKCIKKELFSDLKYPKDAFIKGLQGIVSISFIINEDGSTTPIKVISSPAPELEQEALRVAEKLNTYWTPGKIKSTPIKTRFIIPIRFRIE